jgi:hypothetical protein
MIVQEDIANFLRRNRPKPFCEDCIKKNLRLTRRQQAQATTSVLAQSNNFVKRNGICFDLNETKLVTNAV